MLRQAKLRNRFEPLQIDYPSGWKGQKSVSEDDSTLLISTHPRFLTDDEIELVEGSLSRLSYRQHLDRTGAVLIDPNDSLLQASHSELDAAEQASQMPNTRFLPGGGERSLRERVLILRERGYQGNGKLALSGV